MAIIKTCPLIIIIKRPVSYVNTVWKKEEGDVSECELMGFSQPQTYFIGFVIN